MLDNEIKLILSSMRIGFLMESESRPEIISSPKDLYNLANQSGIGNIFFNQFTCFISKSMNSKTLLKALKKSNLDINFKLLKEIMDSYLIKDTPYGIAVTLSLICLGGKTPQIPEYQHENLFDPSCMRDLIVKTCMFTNIAKIWPYISSYSLPDIKMEQLEKYLTTVLLTVLPSIDHPDQIIKSHIQSAFGKSLHIVDFNFFLKHLSKSP